MDKSTYPSRPNLVALKTRGDDAAMSDPETSDISAWEAKGASKSSKPVQERERAKHVRPTQKVQKFYVLRSRPSSHEPGVISPSSFAENVSKALRHPSRAVQFWAQSNLEEITGRDVQLRQKNEELQKEIEALKQQLLSRESDISQTKGQTQSAAASGTDKDAEIVRLRTDNAELEAKLKQMYSRLGALQAQQRAPQPSFTQQIRRLEEDHKRLNEELASMRDKSKAKESEVLRFKQLYEGADAELRSAKSSMREKDTRILQVERRLEEETRKGSKLRSSIRTIQEKHFLSLDSAHFMPEAMAEINHRLSAILADIKQWSKGYAIDRTPLSHDIANILRSSEYLLGSEDRLRAVFLRKKVGSSLFVSAAVAAVAFFRIMGDPFFAFREERSRDARALSFDTESVRKLLGLIERSMYTVATASG